LRLCSLFICVQAEQALACDEVPVGCVFVNQDTVIGRGMNDTNRSLNVGLLGMEMGFPTTSAATVDVYLANLFWRAQDMPK